MVDQNIDPHSSDAVHGVETALTALWDKAREASLLISTMREERKRLSQRIIELEEELTVLRTANETLQSQASESGKKTDSIALDAEERRALQQKVRSLIAKIDQYIAP